MKNFLIILGLLSIATTVVQAQSSPKIVQKGANNVVKMEVKTPTSDTLVSPERVITQNGSNQVLIESHVSPDSLTKALENVTVQQKGKGNAVSVQNTGGKNNTVTISQSGSGNSVSIKQN